MIRIRPPKLEEIKEDGPLGALKANTTRNASETKNSTIPRNVNFYRHLINDKYASENDIEWVLKLRSQEGANKAKLEQTSTQPFGFDGKTIEAQKEGRVTLDLDSKNHLHQVQHLFLNRTGATPSQGTVFFETGLRSYGSSSERLRGLERNWRTAAKKDRHDFPTLYPSYDETLKVKTWSTKNLDIKTHTAFDGDQNYPKYGELYYRQTRNVQDVRHILKAPGKLMATANWELSMRQYGENVKPREYYEQEDMKKTLGPLKKVNTKKMLGHKEVMNK